MFLKALNEWRNETKLESLKGNEGPNKKREITGTFEDIYECFFQFGFRTFSLINGHWSDSECCSFTEKIKNKIEINDCANIFQEFFIQLSFKKNKIKRKCLFGFFHANRQIIMFLVVKKTHWNEEKSRLKKKLMEWRGKKYFHLCRVLHQFVLFVLHRRRMRSIRDMLFKSELTCGLTVWMI